MNDWKNAIDIAAGSNFVIGLTVDGTILATGDNKNGQCNIAKFEQEST